MIRDEAAGKKGYTSNSYLDVLGEQTTICYKPGRTPMQDNARIHRAKIIKSCFKDMRQRYLICLHNRRI